MLTDPNEDYARGFVPFLDQKIFLDSRPLIPRTETEYWVEKALREIPRDKEVRVLDLFAGSGCIGVAILAHVPNAHVTFGEKEIRHLETIKKSTLENNTDLTRASIVQSDVWSGIAGPFEYIFANPPYISRERLSADESVVQTEPDEALFAEDDGFYFIEKIIEKLTRFLTPNGVCFIEHEPFQVARLQKEAELAGFSADAFKDQYGVLRYSRLVHTMA